MNVFEYAEKMELDGIHFYREASDCTTKPGFKNILQLLSNEEQKHYNFFDSLQKNAYAGQLSGFPLDKAENIFQQLWRNKEGFDFSAVQVEFYKRAFEVEKQSERFYRAQAEKAENEKHREQFLKVAEEERKHMILVDGLVEYLKRPMDWVEHAMFTHPRPEY